MTPPTSALVVAVALAIGCSGTTGGVTPIIPCAFSARAERTVGPTELQFAVAHAPESDGRPLAEKLGRALERAASRDILGLLDHPNPAVRKVALDYLIAERPRSWEDIAQRSATRKDLEPSIVEALCHAIDGVTIQRTGPTHTWYQAAFLLGLARRRSPSELAGKALVCVAEERASEARTLALEWLGGSERGLVPYAVSALGRGNALFEVDRLAKFADDADVKVRLAAVDALGHIPSSPAAAALLKLGRESPDEMVRDRAWSVWLEHPERRTGTLSPAAARQVMLPLLPGILRALRQRNVDALARLVDPERGLRFGLCGQWVPSALYPAQIRGLLRNQNAVSWGGRCGQVPNELSFEDYLDYLVGYEDAPVVGYNTWLRPSPTNPASPAAATERAFPDGVFVELAYPQGHDGQTPWESLVLVFADSSGRYRLVGLLHAEAPVPPKTEGVRVPPPEELMTEERRH